ncbi:MAG: class I SAM-dependent methyltransferase [Acidimicrobiales bacterium]
MSPRSARAQELARRGVRSLRAARGAWIEDATPRQAEPEPRPEPVAPPEPQVPPWPLEGPGPSFPGLISQPCTDGQIRSPAYATWGPRLHVDILFHRKQWEWIYIAQALEEAGVVGPLARGLGFGVGAEPLTSWFASQGCAVTATDYPGGENAEEWATTGELATSLSQLNASGICPDQLFAERVTFRQVDMREIPDDLVDFDFTWSSCAFEHLGSIDNGLRFIVDQMRTLRPGGVAVHTTELNVSSATDTLEAEQCVLFRRRDIEGLAAELTAAGHQIACTFHTGDHPNDRWIDRPPFTQTHLKLALGEHVTTSFGVLVRKAG